MKIANPCFFIFLACLSLPCFSFREKEGGSREVFLVSGGFNAATGCHAIRLTPRGAEIDTAYIPADLGFTFKNDSAWLRKHQVFHADMEKPLKNRAVYQWLMKLDRDTLSAYAERSHASEGGYSVQPVVLHDGGRVDSLEFYLPVKIRDGGSEYNQFIFGLSRLFPFGPYAVDPCHIHAITFYR